MYWHSSYISDAFANPINKLVYCNLSEPAIGYARRLKHHIAYLWRLAAMCPGCTVDSYDDNVSGVFPQLMHHPDIARGDVSLHDNKMIMSFALYFGDNYGPASWEPIACTRCFVAQWMFQHMLYQEEINDKAINLMTLPDDDNNTNAYKIHPQFDAINGTVKNSKGVFVTEYRTFVNNLLSAIPCHLKNTRHFIASSIELV